MYYVYVIQSLRDNKFYTGFASNLNRRIEEHNLKAEFSTKARTPFRLTYYEACLDKKDAFMRERKLKYHGSAIGHLKKRIAYSLKK